MPAVSIAMNMFEAAVALVKAGEQNAEAVAHAFVSEVQKHLEGLIAGMDGRIAALEAKVADGAASDLTSLGDRVGALEKAAGVTVDDGQVASAIADLGAAPTSASAGAAEPLPADSPAADPATSALTAAGGVGAAG